VAIGVLVLVAGIDACRIARTLPRSLFGDEWRYLYYANNLLHGFYSPRERIFLWNGPGYPFLLAPFVRAGWVDGARYANALVHGAAMAYAWLILRRLMTTWWALGGVVLLAVYEPLNQHLPWLYTEVLSFFLVTAWVHHALASPASGVQRIIAGCYLGFLCLTKVIVGAVLPVYLLAAAAVWLRRRSDIVRPYLIQVVVAFSLCLPYLAYTYHLTGKALYWSTAGANSFYWLTSPYSEEWGDWYHQGWVRENPVLRAHHQKIFDQTTGLAQDPTLSASEQVFNLGTPESASVFREAGLRNLREHPLKFAKNWAANLVRLFLDVPVSVRGTPFWNLYSLYNLPFLAWTAFVAGFAWRRRVAPPWRWWPIAALALLVLGAYSLSSASARHLVPLVPIWWLGTLGWFRVALRKGKTPLG
jgi:hypothetical protein